MIIEMRRAKCNYKNNLGGGSEPNQRNIYCMPIYLSVGTHDSKFQPYVTHLYIYIYK